MINYLEEISHLASAMGSIMDLSAETGHRGVRFRIAFENACLMETSLSPSNDHIMLYHRRSLDHSVSPQLCSISPRTVFDRDLEIGKHAKSHSTRH